MEGSDNHGATLSSVPRIRCHRFAAHSNGGRASPNLWEPHAIQFPCLPRVSAQQIAETQVETQDFASQPRCSLDKEDYLDFLAEITLILQSNNADCHCKPPAWVLFSSSFQRQISPRSIVSLPPSLHLPAFLLPL